MGVSVESAQRPRRILHAASFYARTPGSFVPLLVALGRRLSERGDDLAFVAPQLADATWHDTLRDAGFELHLVANAGEAARFARAWRPDLTHVHFFGWETALTTALWLSPTRLFWQVHSTVTSHPNRRAALTPRSWAKYRLLGARVERFIAVSDAIRAELVNQGAPRSRVALVPNAVDAARFRPPTAAERGAARAGLNLGARRTILFFGRDAWIKGADVLAGALRELERPALIAVATTPEVRAQLAAYADVVAFDHVEDVVPLLWAADALAAPSRAEGFGLVVREAALTGLPIAASDLSALREAAGTASGGAHFAPVGDATALAAALRAALDEPRGERAGRGGDALGAWAGAVLALYDRPNV